MIVAEEEGDIDLDEQISPGGHETDESLFLSNVLRNLAINSELMVAKPSLPIRLGITAVAYDDLQNTEIIKVNSVIFFRTLIAFVLLSSDPASQNIQR